ncbi:MAG TPA: metallophosphoesterase family protein [Candidatus Polarisedimenticolia bacterium]|nr:metallophosphoesterase family protein [Candidatus Polarisedimenticolia bacterium]
MRYLVLSDLHSNLEALEVALERARGLGYDRVLVLGDVVGYGPDPNPVIDVLRGLQNLTAIRGNHDKVAAGLEEGEDFNEAARTAALWTRGVLTPEARDFLRALPQGPRPFAPGRLLAHGSPCDEDRYLLDEREARRCFDGVRFDLCFFGHSHYPCAFSLDGSRVGLEPARGDAVVFRLAPGHRYLINPGSLGQPRDRNPKCSFAIFDDSAGAVAIHRVAYPHQVTRDKMLSAGLPAALGERLRLGV